MGLRTIVYTYVTIVYTLIVYTYVLKDVLNIMYE